MAEITGMQLRILRTLDHKPQRFVAEKLGVARSLISFWENNIYPIPERHYKKLERLFRRKIEN